MPIFTSSGLDPFQGARLSCSKSIAKKLPPKLFRNVDTSFFGEYPQSNTTSNSQSVNVLRSKAKAQGTSSENHQYYGNNVESSARLPELDIKGCYAQGQVYYGCDKPKILRAIFFHSRSGHFGVRTGMRILQVGARPASVSQAGHVDHRSRELALKR